MYIHILSIYICTCVQIYTYFLIFQPPRSEVNRFLCLHPSCPKEKLIRDQRLQGFQGQKNEFPFLQFESQTELRTTTKLMMKKTICLVQEKAKTAEKIATCNGIYLSFTGKKKMRQNSSKAIYHIHRDLLFFNIFLHHSFKSPHRALQSANSTMHQTTTGRMTSLFRTHQLSAIHGSVIQWYTDAVDGRLFIRLSSFIHIYSTIYRLRYLVYPCV